MDTSCPVSVEDVLAAVSDGTILEHLNKNVEESVSQHFNEKLDPFQACRFVHTRTINGSTILIHKHPIGIPKTTQRDLSAL